MMRHSIAVQHRSSNSRVATTPSTLPQITQHVLGFSASAWPAAGQADVRTMAVTIQCASASQNQAPVAVVLRPSSIKDHALLVLGLGVVFARCSHQDQHHIDDGLLLGSLVWKA
jgi:hypothetical protein